MRDPGKSPGSREEREALMWRRLLAELHPDRPGGNAELFAFVSNLRDEAMERRSAPISRNDPAAFTGNVPLDLLVLYLRMWSR